MTSRRVRDGEQISSAETVAKEDVRQTTSFVGIVEQGDTLGVPGPRDGGQPVHFILTPALLFIYLLSPSLEYGHCESWS